ncbi:hypothetical protein [Ectobacillus polymachus]|uniref:hypothetical protein n=1 Tax=Ectobacillus polymachus TaxID=1508806 RepID=UPI003A847747
MHNDGMYKAAFPEQTPSVKKKVTITQIVSVLLRFSYKNNLHTVSSSFSRIIYLEIKSNVCYAVACLESPCNPFKERIISICIISHYTCESYAFLRGIRKICSPIGEHIT